MRPRPSWAIVPVLLAAWPTRAAPDAALSVRAVPAALVLGSGARATIEIDAPGHDVPRVTTNVGRIEHVRAVGEGRFEADYLPPEAAFPQVAIVAAVVRGRCGWISLPLSGRGVAVARSAPNASIQVTIDGASFGPVRADATGEAHVPVVAPPGTRFAFHRDRPLDLNVPPSVHVHAVIAEGSAPADAEQELRVWLLAVTPAGGPRAAAPVATEVTRGSLVGLAETAPGELTGTWRLPPGAAQPETITVRLSDEPGVVAFATVERPAPAPARVEPAAPEPEVLEAAPPVELAPAAAERRLSVAPKAGFTLSAGGLRSTYLGAEALYRPAFLGDRLGLALEAGSFASDRIDEAWAGVQRTEVHGRARFVPLTASVRWHAPFGARHLAWAGVGGGLAHVQSEVSIGSAPARVESGLAAVAQATVAWGLRLGRLVPHAEARVAWHADPGLDTLRGSVTALTLALGCRYDAY